MRTRRRGTRLMRKTVVIRLRLVKRQKLKMFLLSKLLQICCLWRF